MSKKLMQIQSGICLYLENMIYLITNWMTVQDGNPYGYLDNWYGKSNANYCGYQNDEYDKIYEELSTEMNEEKRKEMIQNYSKY